MAHMLRGDDQKVEVPDIINSHLPEMSCGLESRGMSSLIHQKGRDLNDPVLQEG